VLLLINPGEVIMKNLSLKLILVASVISLAVIEAGGQTAMPAELNSSPINEQIKYIEDHTRIYENYRAIREDMFRKMNKNFIDTLMAEKSRVSELMILTSDLNRQTDSLNALLDTTRVSLEEAVTTKNSITVLGVELNKGAYNTIMWTIIGGLIFILAVGFLVFRRNLVVLLRTDKDLKELKEEFATYRQTSRLAREKVEMDYFRQLQKLKGK
jgi:tetrahydromethanopterin S-methyltransferase subunit B